MPHPSPPPLGPFRGYTFVEQQLAWDDAQQYCMERGGVLAKIGTADQQAEAAALSNGRPVWLGASDSIDEGIWHWAYDHSILLTTNGGTVTASTKPWL